MDFDIYTRHSRIPTILSMLETHGGVITSWFPNYPGEHPPGLPGSFHYWPDHILYVLKVAIVSKTDNNINVTGTRHPIRVEVNGQTEQLKTNENNNPLSNSALRRTSCYSQVDLVVCHDPAQTAKQCDIQCCNNTYNYATGEVYMSRPYETLHRLSDLNPTKRNIGIHKYYIELYRNARYSTIFYYILSFIKHDTHIILSILIPYRKLPKLAVLLQLSSQFVPLEPELINMYRRITLKVSTATGGIFGYVFDGNCCLDDDDHIVTIPFLPCVRLITKERYKIYEDIMIMALRCYYIEQAQQKYLRTDDEDDTWFQDYDPLYTHLILHDLYIRRLHKYSGKARKFIFIGKLDEIYNNHHRPFVTRDLHTGVAVRISSTNL